jgi:hypothetical protein
MREIVTELAVNLNPDAKAPIGGDIRRPIVSRRTRVRY